MEPLEIPQTPEEIDAAWLTSALRAGGARIDGGVSSIEVERIGEGVGFLGILARLSLTYEGTPGPGSLIVKMPGADPGARALAMMFKFYEHESRFYADLADRVSLRSPRCYVNLFDAGSGRFLLALEDLDSFGRVGDQVAGCSDDEAMFLIEELARFHAAWSGNAELKTLPWLGETRDVLQPMLQSMFPALLPVFMQRYGDKLPAAVRAVMQGLNTRVMPHFESMMTRTQTLTHGDYRLDNMFLGGSGTDLRLRMVDWQSIATGPGIWDFTYFLCSNLPPEQFRRMFEPLSQRYHDVLQDAGVRDCSLDDMRLDIRRGLLIGIAGGVITGGTLDMANGRAVSLADAMLERFTCAVEDMDALALLD